MMGIAVEIQEPETVKRDYKKSTCITRPFIVVVQSLLDLEDTPSRS
jgi:hypothetical protein